MRITIRSKLVLAISILVVVLFTTSAFLFVNEKKKELSNDIYVNSLAFSRLTAPTVAYDYDLYLKQGSFVYFNREMSRIFEQNDDISSLKIVSFGGEILYDSKIDVDKVYEGDKRISKDPEFLDGIKSENIFAKTLDERVFFIAIDADGGISYVDKDEKPISFVMNEVLLEYLIVPANDKYSVVYGIDYSNLEDRVDRMKERIIYLALFGIMLGVILSFVMSLQITKPIKQLVFGVEEIAKGNFKAHVDIKTHDEINFLGEAFNKMAVDLDLSVEAKLYKERVTRELELATQIQKQLVPAEGKIPKIEGIEISASLIPAEEVGGDIYDFIPLAGMERSEMPNKQEVRPLGRTPLIAKRMLMYLGDVTGHGVAAGIVSSVSNALLYGYSELKDLKKILVEVNRVLDVKTMPTMFMTMCLMDWDAVSGKFLYSSAGQEPIIHYSASGGKATVMSGKGVALGMMRDISPHVQVNEIDLQKGDYLVVYSDGIPECWKNEKENFGMERLVSLIENACKLDTSLAVRDKILGDVKTFASGYKQMDDITI
ncbi:MAG: SpoIIE family protein phosphatase, partial [Patescibacteria group bacterium]